MAAKIVGRLAVLPVEALFGLLAIRAGITEALGFGSAPLASLLPGWLNLAVQVSYVGGGLGMLLGLASSRRNFEAAGLVLVASGAVMRGVVPLAVVGASADALNALTTAALVVVMFAVRLRTVLRGDVVARLEKPR